MACLLSKVLFSSVFLGGGAYTLVMFRSSDQVPYILDITVPNSTNLFELGWCIGEGGGGVLNKWTWMQILAMNYRCWNRLKHSE